MTISDTTVPAAVTAPVWRTSARSVANGQCVQVAVIDGQNERRS